MDILPCHCPNNIVHYWPLDWKGFLLRFIFFKKKYEKIEYLKSRAGARVSTLVHFLGCYNQYMILCMFL